MDCLINPQITRSIEVSGIINAEKQKIEDEVNKVIKMELDITREEMPLDKALKSGAQAEFGAK